MAQQALDSGVNEESQTEAMNIFELLFLLLALLLSYLFCKYFVGQIGWWGVIPGVILGFGLLACLLEVLGKFFDRRDRGDRPK